MSITTVIIDDEALARQELAYLLEKFSDIEIVGEAANGPDALELIRRERPQLAFLDIQMPGFSGFQVVRELMRTEDELPQVVFVTAYDEYAIEAFEVNAADYLLKPVLHDRLERSIARVKNSVESPTEINARLDALLSALQRQEKYLTRLPVRRGSEVALLNVKDVVYAYVADGVVFVVTKRGEDITSYRSLDELQADLDPESFWRVHRSHIANIDQIELITPWFSGTYHLKMKDPDGTEIPLSRAQAKKLRQVLKW